MLLPDPAPRAGTGGFWRVPGRVLHRAAPWVGVAALLAAAWLLQGWLRGQSLAGIGAAMQALPPSALLLAAGLTVANYAVLAGYDLLALRDLGRRLPWRAVAATATIANALGNSLGNTLVTGAAVRYWGYAARGLSGGEITRLVLFCSAGFWLGYLLLGGLLLCVAPPAWPPAWPGLAAGTAAVGSAMLALVLAWAVLVAANRRAPLAWRGRALRLPAPATSAGQLAVGTIDVTLMVSAFHVLLPAGVHWSTSAAAVLLAVVAGNLSLVPAGLGVFESVVVLLLGPTVPAPALAAALLAYRLVYFVAPLVGAGVLLAVRTGGQWRTLVPAGWRRRRALRPARAPLPLPGPAELERAGAIALRSRETSAQLVFRGDKALLFSEAGDAFLMYGRSGRCWVALGDPVGSAAGARELRLRFRALCDSHGARCVFFEVRGERRADYAELGLVLTMVGEQARVDLRGFTLQGPARRALRRDHARLLRLGCTFEVVPAAGVPAITAELAEVSAAWLARKPTQEKGFSLGSFDPAYLARFPVAVVRCGSRIVGFANVWRGADQEELSIDLMRYRPDAPHGTMDFLFSELLLWGSAQGFRWFDFGMAPLAGVDRRGDAVVWSRVARLLYRHGEHFYHFEGLRRFKAKFDPVWTPLFLASPGGLALPAVLVDVTALVAGSLAGIVMHHPRQDD